MRRNGFGFSSGMSESDRKAVIRVWMISIAAIVWMYWYMFHIGQFGHLWTVVHLNVHFYVVLFATWAFGVWWWKKHDNFSSGELACFAGFVPFSVLPMVCLGFLFLTDIGDTEILNGYAQKCVYTERYYTESTDDDGNTTTTWWGPYYTLGTTVGDVTVTEGTWLSYVGLWGGQSKVTWSKNWSADGPASAGYQTIDWDGKDVNMLPVSVEHPYVNYVKGSNSVAKRVGSASLYKPLLLKYPRVHDGGGFGAIRFDRVLCASTEVGGEFRSEVTKAFDLALRHLGKSKEVNIVVYVVGTDDVGFAQALEEYWGMGKQNDVLIVIGYTGKKIRWSQVIAYTHNELFKEKLAGAVRKLETLEGKSQEFSQAVLDQIRAPGDAGFTRLSMEHYKYLASSAKMPLWASALIIIGTLILQLPTIWLFLFD